METKNLTVRLTPELHKKLKLKLVQEERSFQGWAIEKIREYVEEENQ